MARSRDDDAGDREDDAPRSRRRQDDEDEFEPRHRTPVKSNDSGLVLGIIGLVFGTLALMFSFIPCLGMFALYPGILAAILSAIGLFLSVRSKALPAVALAVSIGSIGMALWQESRVKGVGNEIEQKLKEGGEQIDRGLKAQKEKDQLEKERLDKEKKDREKKDKTND